MLAEVDFPKNSDATELNDCQEILLIQAYVLVFGPYDFVETVEVAKAEELCTLVTNATRNIRGVAETESLVVGS